MLEAGEIDDKTLEFKIGATQLPLQGYSFLLEFQIPLGIFRANHSGLIKYMLFTGWGYDQTELPFHATGAAPTVTAPAEPQSIPPGWCLGPAARIKWLFVGAPRTVRRNGVSPPLEAPAASTTPTGSPSSTATLSDHHPAPLGTQV